MDSIYVSLFTFTCVLTGSWINLRWIMKKDPRYWIECYNLLWMDCFYGCLQDWKLKSCLITAWYMSIQTYFCSYQTSFKLEQCPNLGKSEKSVLKIGQNRIFLTEILPNDHWVMLQKFHENCSTHFENSKNDLNSYNRISKKFTARDDLARKNIIHEFEALHKWRRRGSVGRDMDIDKQWHERAEGSIPRLIRYILFFPLFF